MTTTVHELDVRPLLAAGQSPLDAVLAAAHALPHDVALRLVAPFEPTPLFAKLAALGLEHAVTPLADGSVSVLFSPRTEELDLRHLEPPAPMQRTLEAAATMLPKARIVTRTRFRPVHLLALLEDQGFSATSTEEPDGTWRNRIVRTSTAA